MPVGSVLSYSPRHEYPSGCHGDHWSWIICAMDEDVTRYPCPVCGANADLTGPCPGCGRAPDPRAADVVRLDARLATLAEETERARLAYTAAIGRLNGVRAERNALAAQVRARASAELPSTALAAPTPPWVPPL